MIWMLSAVVLGATTLVASALAIWLLVDRNRLRRRFAGILDLEREIAARRHGFNIELSRRQSIFDSEIAARRRAIEIASAKHAAERLPEPRKPSAATN